MTVLTDFPLGMVRLVPLRLHGLVEIVVGVALVSLPWLLTRAVALGDRGRIFYTAFGAVLIAVFVATDYAGGARRA
jgi:drug/metabolite transporter (DMT)-like permease